jgi:Na+/phosphate symporter
MNNSSHKKLRRDIVKIKKFLAENKGVQIAVPKESQEIMKAINAKIDNMTANITNETIGNTQEEIVKNIGDFSIEMENTSKLLKEWMNNFTTNTKK